MNYQNENIKFNMDKILDNIFVNKVISLEEDAYAKRVMEFKILHDDILRERELLDVQIDIEKIRRYIDLKREELVHKLKHTKKDDKISKYNALIKNIDKFNKTEAIKFFKNYLVDHSFISRINKYKAFKNIIDIDNKLSCFYKYNDYSQEFSLNRDLIYILRQVLKGNNRLYNAIKKRNQLIKDHASKSEIEKASFIIPKKYINIDISGINNVVTLIRGRKNKEYDDNMLSLHLLCELDEVMYADYESFNNELINDSIASIVDDIINGVITAKDFYNYELLRYFNKDTDDTKIRSLLSLYNYDIDALKKYIMKDELLEATSIDGMDNMFKYKNGYLRVENISLASSILNNESINEMEALSSDPSCLDRIKHYLSKYKGCEECLNKDRYDIKILLAIAKYKKNKLSFYK